MLQCTSRAANTARDAILAHFSLSIHSCLSRPPSMKKWLVCLFLAVAGNAMAAPSCSEFTPGGQCPVLNNAKMARKTRMLCYTDFAVLNSCITHGPLWSAEHLTRDHIEAAKDMVRTNKFFEDARLPDGEGPTLADQHA